jgi:NAD/NADP transhydrogenase alpha subunit
VHLHLRAETKTAEHRSALTPTTTAALLKAGSRIVMSLLTVGFKVSVERSDLRIFDDEEFGA